MNEKVWYWLKIGIAITLFIGLAAAMDKCEAAGSQSDDVSWAAPAQRVDGTPLALSEIAKYEMEVWRNGAVVDRREFAPGETGVNIPRELPPNYELCYVMRTYATTPAEPSDWSPMVCKTVKARPNPPGQLDVK